MPHLLIHKPPKSSPEAPLLFREPTLFGVSPSSGPVPLLRPSHPIPLTDSHLTREGPASLDSGQLPCTPFFTTHTPLGGVFHTSPRIASEAWRDGWPGTKQKPGDAGPRRPPRPQDTEETQACGVSLALFIDSGSRNRLSAAGRPGPAC